MVVEMILNLKISTESNQFNVSITPPPGELLIPHNITTEEFINQKSKLKGMNQVDGDISKCIDTEQIVSNILQCANLAVIKEDEKLGEFLFSSKTRIIKDSKILLISVLKDINKNTAKLIINCEDSMFASVLCGEITKILSENS